MGKTVNIGGRIHNPEVGNVVAGANEILDDTKGKKQNVINSEVDTALAGLDSGKQDKLNFDQTPTESSMNPVTSGGVYAADQVLQQAIEAILLLIPSAASALNQLADKSFVNSSIATASATFRGTYNLISDLHLSVSASHQDIATALASAVSTADNNDYCFVQIPTSDTSSDIRVTERYKFNGTAWQYEYDLNNSGFTAQQWAAINSTITSALVGKLSALPTADELAILLAGKQATLIFDSTPTPGSANPVTSGGLYEKFEAIIAKIPSDASANNKLVAENRLAAYVGGIIGALDATFDLTSTDGHVTLKITQTDGLIASVQVLTSDIASAAQVSQNTSDIATLQDLYNALQQSAPEIIQPTDTWPVANPSDTVIYRVIDRVNTPPEYYSDYMWNGTAMVLMATYNNAIDPRPKKGSANLVTSGGVFDNIGALDISELNASGGTLATYATLDAALAAIPSDYQKGGMSIKFVQTSDNKYVQFRYMNSSTAAADFANISNWYGEDNILAKVFGGKSLFAQYGTLNKDTGANKNDDAYFRTPLADMALLPTDVATMTLKNVGGTASSENALICFYDSSKTFISSVTFVDNQKEYTINIPSTAVYFRVSSLRSILSNATQIIFGDIFYLFQNKASRNEVALKADKAQADYNTNGVNVANGVLLSTFNDDVLPTKETNGYWGINGVYYEAATYRTTKPVKVSVGNYITMSLAGLCSNLTLVTQGGDYIKTLVALPIGTTGVENIEYSFDFDGYITISYRATEGLSYKLFKSDAYRELAEYIGYKGKEYLSPDLKSPNGYWGADRNYYEANSYRTSVPIEVKIGDKLEVTAAGNVSMISRVYQDGRYMNMIQHGSDTVGTYNYISTFNGYIAISWRAENGLSLSIVRASGSEDNGALSGVKWGAMGDSFTDPATLSGQPDTRNYVDLIAEQTGVDVINYGKSGGGYKAREAQNEAFYQVALAVASNLDVVTIFGSGNDQNWVTLEQIGTARDTGTETLCGCMNTAIDNLISVNPLVRIGLVTPTPWRNYPPDSTTATWMKIYSERIIEVAALRGIPCLDLYHDSNLRPWNADCLAALYIDNTHPNTEGHKRIASQIKAFLIEMAG